MINELACSNETNPTGTSGTKEEAPRVIWKDKAKYFIRSECRKYQISKTFTGKEAQYTVWFIEFPDSHLCRGLMLGRSVGTVAAARAMCDEHLKATMRG